MGPWSNRSLPHIGLGNREHCDLGKQRTQIPWLALVFSGFLKVLPSFFLAVDIGNGPGRGRGQHGGKETQQKDIFGSFGDGIWAKAAIGAQFVTLFSWWFRQQSRRLGANGWVLPGVTKPKRENS